MTPMQIRELISCPDHRTTIVVLEDVGQRLRLAMHTDLHQGQRLAREMGRAPCTGNPIYDFIQSLLDSFQAAVSRVMLDDVQGIGGVIYLRGPEAELTFPCYPPDALALALRAKAPIYATPEALAHAEPLSAPETPPEHPADVRQWLERVKPEDFSLPQA